MAEPEFLMTDFAKMEFPGQLHLGFQAIHAFQKKHGHLPAPWSQVHITHDGGNILLFEKSVASFSFSFFFFFKVGSSWKGGSTFIKSMC